jgi:hypothetical protein
MLPLKKYGHIEKFCRLKNEKQANYIEEQRDDGSEKKNDESTFYAYQSIIEKKDDVWYIDSGCTKHMTGNESIFCKFDTTVTTQIIMGNGAVVKSKGKGTIAMASKNGKILIHDVLFVPDLAQNFAKCWTIN